MNVKKFISISYMLSLLLLATNINAATLQHILNPKFCKEGIINGPKNHFAIYVFCDDSIGTTIGVIKREPYVTPEGYDTRWKERPADESDRFWSNPLWGRDVDKVIWSEDGTKLTVFTDSIYGTGKTYYLDLLQKTFRVKN